MKTQVLAVVAWMMICLMLGSGAAAATTHNAVPDVRGMVVGKARAEIAVAGFNMKVTDQFQVGDVVGEQTPKAGEQWPFDGFVAVVPTKAVPAQAPAVTPPPDIAPIQPKPAPRPRKLAAAGKSLVLPPNISAGTYILRVSGGGTVGALTTAGDVTFDGPSPGPGPTPTPGPVSDVAKAIKAMADKATGDPKRVETCQGLAIVYREIAASIKDTTDPEAITDTVNTVTNALLARQGAAALVAWKPTRDAMTAYFVELVTNDAKPAEFAALLNQAADGLETSSPKQATAKQFKTPAGLTVSISPEFWTFLLELLKMILPLLMG